MKSESKFCEDYTVQFLLMYNVIDKDELEEIESIKRIREDSVYQLMLAPEMEKSMLDSIDVEYEQSIGRLLDGLRTSYPRIISETIMQLNDLLIKNQATAAKLGLRVPPSITQALPSLDYYHNYEKCVDNLQKLEVLGMK